MLARSLYLLGKGLATDPCANDAPTSCIGWYPWRVELLFEDATLAELCSSQGRLVSRFGPATARAICARLHELEAAASPSELELLPHLDLREVASPPAAVSLALADGHRLVLRATSQTVEASSPEWANAASVIAAELVEADPH